MPVTILLRASHMIGMKEQNDLLSSRGCCAASGKPSPEWTSSQRKRNMNIKSFIQRHSVVAYFVLAFSISWGGSLAMLGPKFVRGQSYSMVETVLSLLAMVIGPSLAGIALTYTIDGRKGVEDLLARLHRWRVGLEWYAISLLTAPAALLLTLVLLSQLISPVFAPGFFALGIAYGIVAGYFEEIGWMGYAFPKMMLKYNVLTASAILGVLHGTWHFFADYLGSIGAMGSYWLPHFLVQYVGAMTVTRILMGWVYIRTRSVLLAQLLHASSTGFLVALGPAALTPAQSTIADAGYVVVLSIVVALLLFLTNGQQSLQQSLYSNPI
jgi:membrane protease YdiL (CAAX protease family)